MNRHARSEEAKTSLHLHVKTALAFDSDDGLVAFRTANALVGMDATSFRVHRLGCSLGGCTVNNHIDDLMKNHRLFAWNMGMTWLQLAQDPQHRDAAVSLLRHYRSEIVAADPNMGSQIDRF